jgi:hypothetical protein
MARSRITLLSPLTREECVRRLREQVDPDGTIFGKKPVIGRVRETSLRLRKRIRGRNSFQTFLTAKMAEESGKTRFDCRFGMHPAVVAFMAFWFGGVLAIGAGAVIELSGIAAALSVAEPMVLLGPLAMVAFGIGLVTLGRFSSRDDAQFLTEFVRSAVEGKIQPPGAVSPRGG